ncbi:hypothetical protein QN397_17380 [Variovorax sp. RTB1]|uniref:hypothetical protein n=1 Tax=Variovorax sp. RTB1 TaxID=3048631 RepID=UPI002B2360CC|nr:hypothetical protein [Variovorax sp. RTB1]MEB0113124.1 hypothetical protein [Variovorax sp. RTB1]
MLKSFGFYVVLAILAKLPGLAMRLSGTHVSHLIDVCTSDLAILGAGFMLSWSLETAEEHVSRGIALAVIALITVLTEYVVDIYYVSGGKAARLRLHSVCCCEHNRR